MNLLFTVSFYPFTCYLHVIYIVCKFSTFPVKLEKLLVGAANSDDFSEHLEEQPGFCFLTDIDCGRLGHQLHLVHDAVRTGLPAVRQVTNIRTMCEAFNKTPVAKTLLGEAQKLLRLYLTLPWHRRLQSVHFLLSDDSRTT